MTDAVRERCELLSKNRTAIRTGFLHEKELMSVAAGNSIIANTLALVWAKQIASMISAATSVASSLLTASLKTETTEEE